MVQTYSLAVRHSFAGMDSSFRLGSFHLPSETFKEAFAFHLTFLQIIRQNCSFPFQGTSFVVELISLPYSITLSIIETSCAYTSRKPIDNNGIKYSGLFPHKEFQDIVQVTSYPRWNSMFVMNSTNFDFLPLILSIKFLFSFSLRAEPHFSLSSVQISLEVQVAHQIVFESIFEMSQFANLCAQFAFSNFLSIKVEDQDPFIKIQLNIKDLFNFSPLNLYIFNVLFMINLLNFC